MLRLILLLLIVSCVATEEKVSSGGAANPDAPSRWPLGSFPKTVKFSNAFTAGELTPIHNSAVSWTTHAGAGTTFINSSVAAGGLVPEKSGVSDLDSLMDSTFAVYKATTWHSDLPSTALAVTQIFGVRRNKGDSNEYVEIVEGDILVNYDFFSFAPATPGGYDLFTVLLHEFGHFLGLNHTMNFSSVMYPSIGFGTTYVKPGFTDIATIQSKYGLNGATPSAARKAAPVVEEPSTKEDVLESGNGVRITLELHAHGECVHKINGTRAGSHPVELK